MIFSMVFQTLSVLVSKTADESVDNMSMVSAVGEVLSSIAQVYLFNAITKFTGTWFDNRGRSIATAIIIIASILGNYTFVWITNYVVNLNPQTYPDVDLFEIIDDCKLILFILNVILTIVIIIFFQTKPQDNYPTGSQLYHRSKMYEPHLDVKYLLQYKEFKLFAIATGFLLTAVNVVQAVPATFIFPEASANRDVVNIS